MKPLHYLTILISFGLTGTASAQGQPYSAGTYNKDGSYTRPYQDRNTGDGDKKKEDLSGTHHVDPYKLEETVGELPEAGNYDAETGSYKHPSQN